MKKVSKTIAPPSPYTTLDSATGPIPIPMHNDYLFRALLQRNNKVLKGLICSLLRLSSEQVQTVTITNPIELGDTVDSKVFFLDIRVLMNDHAYINLEMQVVNEYNWVERSLCYLCRSFDSLEHGQDYSEARPSVQIGLLNFTLFPENPEFYSTYQFLNVKNHMLYSDKLRLSVLDLTRIDLATEEDRSYHIDYWASLFKSTTWEEIKMLAQKDDCIKDASNTIYQLSQDEKIRLQCEAREDYYRRECRIAKQHKAIDDLEARIAAKDAVIANMQNAVSEKDAVIAGMQNAVSEKDAVIAGMQNAASEKDAVIAGMQNAVSEKDAVIAGMQNAVSEKDVQIAALKAELERLKAN
ncbi:MAG: Rpn family recombination-promoting nuclease/putative transposase [Blautia sp.]|nr:Rpn family recombination-promoting nuclease/putative transposase [Blautia sp.]